MSKVDIAPVLEHYGADLPAPNTFGKWQKVRCPFHEDRQASATVNFETNRFRCFACDFKGDGIDIVKWREGFDYARSCEFIASVLGGSVRQVRAEPSASEGLFGRARILPGQRSIFQAGRS